MVSEERIAFLDYLWSEETEDPVTMEWRDNTLHFYP